MIEIYAAKLNKMKDITLLNRLIIHLSEDKQNRVKRFRNIEDALRTVIADVMVRILACNKLGVMNQDIVFSINEYGKPYLKGYREFNFNISHSCEWVVCAFDRLPIGIDIEMIKPIDIKIAERFYSEHEVNELMNREASQRQDLFYDLWTLRESYIKAIGKGLYIPLDSFSFQINDNSFDLVTDGEIKNYHFKQYNIDSKYKTAVCSLSNEFSEKIIYYQLEEIFERSLLEKC